MGSFLNDLLGQLKGIWARLDGSQRMTVVAVMAATIVGLGAMVWYASQPSYENVLVAESPDQLKDARRMLSQAGVPFVTDGQNVLVERSRVAEANGIIFEGGLRSGASTNKLDEQLSLTHDRQTRADILDSKARARAEAAIGEIEGVVAVRVASSKPRRSVFRDRDKETQPRATVTLRLRPGVMFEKAAKAAASVTASSVGMPMEYVEVINASNHARWVYDADTDTGGGMNEFLAQERALSESATREAQQALDAVYPGKTIVKVNVELERDWELLTQKVLPDEPLVKTDKTVKDSTENGAVKSSGDPSISGDPGSTPVSAGPSSTQKSETRDREYVTDIGERRTGKLAPEIKRVTVAVVYDQKLVADNKVTPDALGSVVKSIVGWDQARDGDDSVSFMGAEFPELPPVEDVSGPGFMDLAVQWAPTVGQILGVVLVLLFLRSLLKRSGPKQDLEPITPEAERELPAEELSRRMRREIERAISEDPAAISKMLEGWLSEQKA